MIRRCDLVPQYEAYKKEIDEAIKRVLLSGRYILAEEVDQFEKEFARYIGIDYAVGVANATDGLALSLIALGIGKGDEVITTPFTAIPTVSAIVDVGVIPVFVDICPDTFLIDLDKVASAITSKTKAIIPVHIFGNVLDVLKLKKLVGHGIRIIEDAAQAHGSKIRENKSGSMGDCGVFSFYPTKNLGGYGDGGAVVTNNLEIAKKIKLLRNYGMVDKDHIVINGLNSRLDELQAAILRIKLNHLDEMNKRRNAIAQHYIKNLRTDLFEHQIIPQNVYSNYHVFVSKFKKDRMKFIQYLENLKIQINIYYPIPLHLQEANKYLGIKKGAFPIAEEICDRVVALPFYPEMKPEVQECIINSVNNFTGA